MCCGGNVTLAQAGNEGTLFSGLGSFGHVRKFKWNEINEIQVEYLKDNSDQPTRPYLVLQGTKRIPLADIINPDLHEFIIGVVQIALADRASVDWPAPPSSPP